MTNHFDTVAHDWDKNKIHLDRTEAIAKELLPLISSKKDGTALEFGSGTGLLSIMLKDHFSEITLMDSSSEMVRVTIEKLAEANIQHLHPLFFDLENSEYTTTTFDVIYTQMALHHTTDVEKIISKFYALLNKGGILAIADLYKEDGSFHDRDFTGHLGFDTVELMELLSKYGFTQIHQKQCYEIERGGDTQKKYPIFLMSAVK